MNFVSSKDNVEERVMHLKVINSNKIIEIMSHDKADEAIEQLFELILSRNQIGFDTSGSDLIFDCANLLYYKCHKINLNRTGYI